MENHYIDPVINENLIIARTAEKNQLDKILNSPEAKLFFLYGRRRIGKTFLIHNYCGNKGYYFYFRAEEKSSTSFAITNFYNEIIEVLKKNGILLKRPPVTNWTEALNYFDEVINTHLLNKKIIILIDEFPWFCSKSSKFLDCFSYYWNKKAVNNPFIKILCTGSSTSFLVNKVIKNKKGLFSRSSSLKMKPFTLSETSKFFRERNIQFNNKKDIIYLYMVFGGIPQYLKEVNSGESVEEIVNRCFCGTNPIFGFEFNELFEGTFSNFELHSSIIEFIKFSKKGKSKTEINNHLKKTYNKYTEKYNGSQLKIAVDDLVQSDLVEKVKMYSLDERSTGDNESLYKLSDEFLLFYVYWIDNNPMIKNPDYWSKDSKTRDLSAWQGEVFERICLKHIDEIFNNMGIHCNVAGYWWKNLKDPASKEIDILVDRDDKTQSIVEIKYYEDVYSLDKNKSQAVIDKKECFDNYKKIEKENQHTKDRIKKNTNIIFITAVGIVKNNDYLRIPITNSIRLIDLL